MRRHGSDIRGSKRVPESSVQSGRFGRMFRRLPACPKYGLPELTGLAESMREPSATPSGWAPSQPLQDHDNPAIPAGYTYFGQFVDHDVTFDPASSLQKANDPDALINFRSPRFDLDSVYGSGPYDEPFQYARDELHLLVPPNAAGFAEVPRNSDGVAIIGDPRNDENVIVSQLHLAFLRLHNRFVDQVTSEGQLTTAPERFAEAQRRTRWHYQWVLVNDFLRRLIGDELLGQLYHRHKNRPPEIKLRYYRAKTSAYMPVEFSAAAYRFGHSQIRDRYALNPHVEQPLFMPGDEHGGLVDLRGGQQVPPAWAIAWPFFFRLGPEEPQPSRLINTKLAPSLFDLPLHRPDEVQSLPLLNLLRGQQLDLPSGQDVARHLGTRVLTSEELRGPDGAPVPEPTPLWYYLLREAEVMAEGKALGPSGGRIVGEVLLGLLEQDPMSYHNVVPEWQPDAGIPRTGVNDQLTVGDLLQFGSGSSTL
jgi:hypothetical protein